jgi:MFS family permease
VNTNEKNILQVTCYGHFLSHFNMLVFPAVLIPLSESLQLSLVETLSLSFWMYLLFGVSALPWGLLADKISARRLLIVFYTGAGVSGLFAAFSMDNAFLFGLSLTGVGLFSGIYHPVGLGWIARNIENTSLAMGYNGMFGNLGLATAPLVAGLINYGFGLKAVYLTLGLLNILGIVLLSRTQNNVNQVAIKRQNNQHNTSLTPFCILLIAMMLGGIVYRGISVTLPAYFQLSNQHLFAALQHMFGGIGTENVVATVITSMIYLLGMVGQYVGGKVGERYDLRRSYFLFHLITIPAAIAMAYSSNIPLIGFAMVHSFFLLGMQPIENTLVSRLAPPGLMSSAYGLKFILTFGVGALSVKVIEAVKLSYGFSTIYLVLACVSVVLVCAITVLIVRTAPLTAKSN